MLYKTNRIFIDVETKEKFCLYQDDQTHSFKLISDDSKIYASGTEVNGFYICTASDIEIKINNSKVIKLKPTQFYSLKENEEITHKKFLFNKKFIKA